MDDDVRLMEAVAGGDREAFACLYDRYAAVMMALAQRMLGPGRDLEDLLHNVFLEAWSKASEYDPARSSVQAWLLMRLRSRALDRLRAAWHERTVRLERWHEELATTGAPDPALSCDGAAVRRALAALPAEQRAVIEMGYFQGLSTSEIARRMSAPVGTVKSRMATALAKLRTDLVGPKPRGETPR